MEIGRVRAARRCLSLPRSRPARLAVTMSHSGSRRTRCGARSSIGTSSTNWPPPAIRFLAMRRAIRFQLHKEQLTLVLGPLLRWQPGRLPDAAVVLDLYQRAVGFHQRAFLFLLPAVRTSSQTLWHYLAAALTLYRQCCLVLSFHVLSRLADVELIVSYVGDEAEALRAVEDDRRDHNPSSAKRATNYLHVERFRLGRTCEYEATQVPINPNSQRLDVDHNGHGLVVDMSPDFSALTRWCVRILVACIGSCKPEAMLQALRVQFVDGTAASRHQRPIASGE